MEDSELTRKAIEELMKEMNEYKEKESLPTERKKNPLGRPNKLFLGRTINSMMNHNKRQSDRNIQRCERKLRELDAKQRKRALKKHYKDYDDKLEDSHEVISSDTDNNHFENKARKRYKRRKKKRRRKCRSPSTSSSESCCRKRDSSSNLSLNSKHKNRKRKRHKIATEEEKYVQDFSSEYINEVGLRYYVDPNMAYAAMAYNQMNHMIQQHELRQQQTVAKDLEENIEIPSDLSISCQSSSESSLNITLHSSSVEEDENGVVTFKLSSDDEENVSQIAVKKPVEFINGDSSLDCCDKETVHPQLLLENKKCGKSFFEGRNEIYILSSSDSEGLEIVETIPENEFLA